jgi:hypothetical protein
LRFVTNVVHPVSDEQLPRLLAALAEAARADQRTANRFVAPRIGVLEETAARRHQFVLGRRGVGKSTHLSVQTGRYRGRRFVGFTLDLSNWTGARSERIKQLEFWTPEGRQEARRARLIYRPGASDLPATPTTTTTSVDEDLDGNWVQSNIFQLLGDPSGAGDGTPVETLSAIASDSEDG